MPAQLQRILLVFLGFILLFLLAKNLLTPDSFGQHGHYRAAALDDNQQQEPKYVDQATCADCHQDIVDLKDEGLHMEVGCQTYTKLETPDSREFCGSCHQLMVGRPGDAVSQVDIEEHNTDDDKCIICHNPHEPWLGL